MLSGLKKASLLSQKICVRTPVLSSMYWNTAPILSEWWHSRSKKSRVEKVFQTKQIAPEEVQYYSGREPEYASGRSIPDSVGEVTNGDWDIGGLREVHPYKSPDEVPPVSEVESLNDLLLPAFHRHFDEGLSWDKTMLYKYITSHIERGETIWHGCTTISDVQRRCRFIDKLYDSIRDQYKSQLELAQQGKVAKTFKQSYLGEILVDVGRDGELLFVDGIHRLTLAKILDVEHVTVSVLARHREYVSE